MVLNGLFKRTGLEQDTGVLPQRWQQEGSEPVSVYFPNADSEVIYTVTTGKKFYVTQLLVYDPAHGSILELIDGGAGGTTRLLLNVDPAAEQHIFNFSVPLVFETNVYVDDAAGDNHDINLIGWEE